MHYIKFFLSFLYRTKKYWLIPSLFFIFLLIIVAYKNTDIIAPFSYFN